MGELLFHYTNQRGLAGILTSGKLHATHYGFLNDTSEVQQLIPNATQLAEQFLRVAVSSGQKPSPEQLAKIGKNGGPEATIVKEAKTIVQCMYRTLYMPTADREHFLEPYVVSFCDHDSEYEKQNGLLSQWRAYGGPLGYALAFDRSDLENEMQKEMETFALNQLKFVRVQYDIDLQPADLAMRFPVLVARLCEMVGHVYPALPVKLNSELIEECLSAFGEASLSFKHRGFEEEREVRLVAWRIRESVFNKFPEEFGLKGKKVKPVFYRDNLSAYVEIDIGSLQRSAIKKIIVGPGIDAQLRKTRLQHFLTINGLKIEVEESKTPFVS